ncbi:MAG: GGDEF domain-containing protein, partial [Lysobacter sp.]
TYTNLPPGAYTFEVRGSNNAGVPGTATARLPFSIKPRFHETASFVALLGLLLVTLVFAGYRFQRHRYRMRQLALESLVHQRTEALEIANRDLEEASRGLEEASHTDPLTGLRNRRYLTRQIPADLAFYDRRAAQGDYPDEVMVFALVDIDHFKSVNDEHGHMAGDRVLTQFAQVLTSLVRTGDYVVRWGGEEFLLVFRPTPTRNLALLGERLCATIAAQPFEIDDGVILRVTCSVGLSEYPLFRNQDVQANWETMVELSDQALYYVKAHGRNGWAAFRPTKLTDLDTLLHDLRDDAEALLLEGRLQLVGSVDAPQRGTN